MSRRLAKISRFLFGAMNFTVATWLTSCSLGPTLDSSCSTRNLQPSRVDYRQTEHHRLSLSIYFPPGHDRSGASPAVLCFHGGSWMHGSPSSFEPHCRWLAERGYVAAAVEYQTRLGHGGSIPEAIVDAREAVRWVRAQAGELGVDPNRIAVMGGSAGGHLALSTALIDDFDFDEAEVSCAPNAVVLFSPPTNTTFDGWPDVSRNPFNDMRYRLVFGDEDPRISPVHHLPREMPPVLIFHSKKDGVVPVSQSIGFVEEMRESGNECVLVLLENGSHPFFENSRSVLLKKAMERSDVFLKDKLQTENVAE